MTNLDYFTAQLEVFPIEERNSIRNYLLGVLSVSPSSADWQKDVQLAIHCHHQVQEHIAKAKKGVSR